MSGSPRQARPDGLSAPAVPPRPEIDHLGLLAGLTPAAPAPFTAERGWIAADRRPDLLARQIFAFAEGLQVHARLYAIDPEGAREAMIDGLVRLLR